MSVLNPDHLLAVWEAGTQRHPIDRALLLLALATPDTPPEGLADVPLGDRNAALFALRRAHFGDTVDGWTDCAACGERMEFALDSAQLPPPAASAAPIEVRGLRFARPTSRHLASALNSHGAEEAAATLLAACARSPLPPGHEALLDEVEAALEAADPWADLSLAVTCPACGHRGAASFDIAALLWEEIDALAHHLLDEVHTLAAAHGWAERDILAMSAPRRAAYLARLQT